MEQYLKRDIAKTINRPIRTIQYWTDEGLVVPDIVPSEGKGKARVYSKRNLIEFAMVNVMCGPGQMYLDLNTAKFILKVLRYGGYEKPDSNFQFVQYAESNKKGGWYVPRGVNPIKDFYTSEDWGKVKELACVLSTDRSLFDEKAITNPVEGFFIIPRDDEFVSKVYREHISCIGDPGAFLPLARQIIFVSAIRNTAMDMFGIKL